ncbi:hypothetical protein SLEP1_g51608 [Rubroshorea leprosula]|uniref:Uncharacterized protein n=1 Tax=Rubroshorea leprosula TaxID=152421 RepID=A0AAV5M715_9ROSI|nr:hypothetical protein SLEP1_g51608 [Rubroshorea leprosula]
MCEHPIGPRGAGHVGMLVLMLLQLGLIGGNLGPLCIAQPCLGVELGLFQHYSPPSVRLTNWDGCSHGPTLLGLCPALFGCWAGPIPNGFNSLRPTSTRAELKGKTKRGELASLKTCGRAGIHSHISVGLLWRRAEVIRNRRACSRTSHACNARSARPCDDLTFEYYRSKMVSLREISELRGNQGRDGEEEGVLSVEPITMIVPPELQDSPETMAPAGNASSNARDDGSDHPTASSSSPSTEETPSREEGMGDVVSSVSDRLVIGEWEGVTILGRLSNLRKAPKDLPAGFRFKAALHHEVADCAPSISGYKRLEKMVRAYHIPKTILLRTGGQNERACTVSQTGWIPVYVDHFDVGLRFPLPGLCRLCPNSQGAKWYYLSGRDKSQLFKNVRNKVARWKRQFVFVRDTRTERISNDLAARLSEWRTPNAHINYPQLLPRDVDLKNQLLEYAQREGLIDLEALVTSEQLAVFGFVDVTNLFTEGEMSSILERQRQRAQSSRGRGASSTSQRQTRFDERPPAAPQPRSLSHRGSSSASRPRAKHRVEAAAPSARRRAREETESEEDELPLARRRTSGGAQPAQVSRPTTVRSPNAPSATVRAAAEPASASASMAGPRIAYPEGFSYVRAECQPAMVQGMHSFVPPMDSKRAKAFVQQHGGQVAMIKLMDAFSYAVALYESEQGARIENRELGSKCKQLATEKASLVDDVNRLQGSEMANRAAAAESRADELANRINELKGELERARAERESGIQAAKDEAAWIEERAKRAEDERDRAQTELDSLRFQASHARSVGIARAQGAEWLVGSSTFQDAVAVASANVTTEIYNEIRGKVLHHRPDFPIRELVFFDEEELDEQGKSLAPLADTTVRLRWDLNEEGVPVWPPSVLEDGEDPAGLPSFDAWPATVPASSPVNAPAPEPAARSPLARSTPPAADASMPVDLTDD